MAKKLECQLTDMEEIQKWPGWREYYQAKKRYAKKVVKGVLKPDGADKKVKNKGPSLKTVRHKSASGTVVLQPGDKVRVLRWEEIEPGLNADSKLKGCRFMSEMQQYCNTVQTVKKQMKNFIDERDFELKKSSGIYLLKNLTCMGTPSDIIPCDRSCFYFWRVEWLEKIETQTGDIEYAGNGKNRQAAVG